MEQSKGDQRVTRAGILDKEVRKGLSNKEAYE